MPSKLYWQSVQLSTSLLTRFGSLVGTGLVGLFGFGCLGCDGCDADTSAPSAPIEPAPPAAPIASIAAMLGVDAGEFESKTDPPAPAGDLSSEIKAFTTVDACIEVRARLDPLLGDALDAIGYETFLSDACRVLDAAKARDGRRCAAIDASVLRDRCKAIVAEVASLPETCPWAIAGQPQDGRDPACVAIASHDGRLCAGVGQLRARATCLAIAEHDAKECARLAGRAAQTRCLRDAARWASTIAAPHDPSTPFVSAGILSFSQASGNGTDDAAGPAISTADLGPDLERGVVLVQSRDGVRFVVGHPEGRGSDRIAPSPLARANLAIALLVPTGGGVPFIERAELLVAGHPPVATPIAHSTLQAKLEKFEATRAGGLKLIVEGELADSTSSWHIRAEVSAFVRDVVGPADSRPSSADQSDRSDRNDQR